MLSILTVVIRLRYNSYKTGVQNKVKWNVENLPELEEAFEAVKGQLFGPPDPAAVKLKHKEIIKDAREKREREFFTLGGRSNASDDHAERGRKDRDFQTRTLTWLLANDRAYREAHERAMASFTNAGSAIDRAIEAGEKALDKARRQIDDYLRSTARLSDGRYVMIDGDGTFRDETGAAISADDVAKVDGQPIKAFKPYEELTAGVADIERDLAELRGWSVEVGDMHNKANDDKVPASRETLDDMKKRADDMAERAKEMQRGFDATSPNTNANRHLDLLERKESTATMAMPQLP